MKFTLALFLLLLSMSTAAASKQGIALSDRRLLSEVASSNRLQQSRSETSSNSAPSSSTSSSGQGNAKGSSSTGSSPSDPTRHTLSVTVGDRAPDCVGRKVLLVNGEFQPALTLTQGDWVEITVVNNIADNSWPSLFEGIAIHWHGFSMKRFPWMDGTNHVSQCAIQQGKSFTYKFQVNEMPGTYFWHDHSSLNRADGLQGPLIVKERRDAKLLFTADADHTLFLSDWWHFAGNAMGMRLNRPFDPTKATSATGSWCWIGLPKSVLLNGVGNYYDCEDPYKRVVNKTLPYRPDDKPVVAAAKDLLSPPCVAGQLGPTAEATRCDVTLGGNQCNKQQRTTLVVQPGSTTRLRLVNAATLVYMTVCFEKHNVTVITLDAAPVEPRTFVECVDINSGQRVDVLLTANQPAGSYWISVGSQYRKGAPSGYGVLRYGNAPGGSQPNPANIVSPAAVVERKWTTEVLNSFHAHPDLVSSASSPSTSPAASYLAPAASGRDTFKLPEKDVDKRYVLISTQPLIEANGMLRWAFDNIAHASTPPCTPVLKSVHASAQRASTNVAKSGTNVLNNEVYWGKLGADTDQLYVGDNGNQLEVVDASRSNADVFIKLNAPSAGTHVLTVQPGQVIEFVIQNNRAGFGGGEYRSSSGLTSNRAGREQHSFHMHGYHFWQVGMGMGAWSPDKVAGYNLDNPPMRDTTTVLFNGTAEDSAAWVAFRIVSNNPGVWPLHCHIDAHMFMGQQLTIISDPQGIAKIDAPDGMPQCPATCMRNFANFNPKASEKLVAGMAAPDNGNLP